MENRITLTVVPVITHELVKVGASVSERLTELNLENLVATDETIQSLKKLRAELNKELEEFETQRKTVKNAVLKPFEELEIVYKAEVATKYTQALDILKGTIGAFEDKLRADKKAAAESYFTELCRTENIDWIPFDSVGLKIDLSTTEKKNREFMDAFIARVKDDLKLIDTQEYRAEIMVEYKRTLNASAAVTSITQRKESEKAEAERIVNDEFNRRKTALLTLGMAFDDFTNTFSLGDIRVVAGDLKYMTKDDYNRLNLEVTTIWKKGQQGETITAPTVQQPAAPAPEKEEIRTARIEVRAPYSVLVELGKYMKEHGITYKNIES